MSEKALDLLMLKSSYIKKARMVYKMNAKELVKYFYEVIVSKNMLDELSKYISDDCVQKMGEIT